MKFQNNKSYKGHTTQINRALVIGSSLFQYQIAFLYYTVRMYIYVMVYLYSAIFIRSFCNPGTCYVIFLLMRCCITKKSFFHRFPSSSFIANGTIQVPYSHCAKLHVERSATVAAVSLTVATTVTLRRRHQIAAAFLATAGHPARTCMVLWMYTTQYVLFIYALLYIQDV